MRTEDFFDDEAARKLRCQAKDAIIQPILDKIPVRSPKNWKALLMPCAHGPEITTFCGSGVPAKNLSAIERLEFRWKRLRDEKGLSVGYQPMDALPAVDHFSAANPEGFDLIYLDFYGQLRNRHREMLEKIFAFRMVKENGTLILNFSRGRGSSEETELNRMLTRNGTCGAVPTKIDVCAAAELAGHKRLRAIQEHEYHSSVGRGKFTYVTTVARV